jgi:hypothetical protein
MTKYEFELEYDKLKQAFKPQFDATARMEAIAKTVMDLDHRWWKLLVQRMIVAYEPRLNIADAASGERRARRAIELSENLSRASEALTERIHTETLGQNLDKLGAGSLWEAIELVRKNKTAIG